MPDRSGSIGATIAIVVGVVLCVVGIAGAAAGWGSTTKTTISPVTPTTNPSAVPSEDVREFIARLDQALRTGDEKFLNARVAIEVTDRYGASTCVTFFHNAKNPGRKLVLRGAPSAPHDFTYETDGEETVVHDVVDVPVNVVEANAAAPDTLQAVPESDGTGATTYRFFTDCGTPRR